MPSTARLNTIAKDFGVEFEPETMREAVRSLATGQPEGAAAKPGERRGQRQAEQGHAGGEQEVRGFMTLNEIVLKTGVPKEHFMKTLDLPSCLDARKPVREWMRQHDKSIQDLRDAVASYRAGSGARQFVR